MSLQKLQLIDTNGLRLNLAFARGNFKFTDLDTERTSQASTENDNEEREPFLRPESPYAVSPQSPRTPEPFEDPGPVPPLKVKKSIPRKPVPAKPVPGPPPNGGLTAWLQVLGAHFLFFNSWGLLNAFGAFQAYYELNSLSSSKPSDISWIGTTQGFVMIAVGVITGPLYDKGYLRTLIYTGTFLSVFGLMMTSLATEFYQIFLALGICVGLGSGCFFVPSVAIVSTYFSTKRAAATGLTAAGGSLGGVIYPIVFRNLEGQIGYGWAIRVMAFLVLSTMAIVAATLKPRVLPAKGRALIDLRAFKDGPFVLFSFALFMIFIGLYIPFFYIPTFSMQKIKLSDDTSFYTLAIMNAASIFGRIGPNILADKVGSLNVLIPFTFVAGGLAFVWIALKNVAGVVVFALFYGFFSGAIVSLPPSALIGLSPDLSVIGSRLGMCFTFAGFGLLIGSPIAGVLLRSDAGYAGLESFCGATVLSGFVFLVLAMLVHKQQKSVP